MTIDDVKDAFALIEDWEERYRYVIELGKDMPPLEASARTEANRVRGCASQVWLVTETDGHGPSARMVFHGDSDAHIVKGLVYITTLFYSGLTAEEVAAADAFQLFMDLGLAEHLTPQRANGVRAMVERIRRDATALL